MKPFFVAAVLVVSLQQKAVSAEPVTLPFHKKCVIRFATVDEGRVAISKKDRFLTALSRFDRQSRIQTDKPVSIDQFVDFVAKEVRAWEKEETERIRTALKSIRDRMRDFSIPFPQTILLIKTSGREEGGAAYCRGNAIILPEPMLKRIGRGLERLLIHELFHILSAHDAKLRGKLYAIIGFQPCPRIQFPKSLVNRQLTNPDSPVIEHYIRIEREGKKVDVVPVLYASVDNYDPEKGGTFFKYLVFRLMALEAQGKRRVPKLVDGQPVLYQPREEKSFLKQIGSNTNYIFHPDEILADNFVHLIFRRKELKSPSIVKSMKSLLSPPATKK